MKEFKLLFSDWKDNLNGSINIEKEQSHINYDNVLQQVAPVPELFYVINKTHCSRLHPSSSSNILL